MENSCSFNKLLAPNYFPNSFGGPTEDERVRKLVPTFKTSGDVHRYQVTRKKYFFTSSSFQLKFLSFASFADKRR